MPIWSTLGLEKARSQLALLAAQAHAGKSSLITRNGKPYAALVPVATLQRESRRGASLLALRGSGADVAARRGTRGADASRRVGVKQSKPLRAARAASPQPWSALPDGCVVVVDTAPIIYLLQNHPLHLPKFIGLFEADAAARLRIAISTVTLAEVLAGPFRDGQDALASRYEKALLRYQVVPLDAAVAVASARLRSRYGLKLPDAVQLATALEIGAEALVTHDRDFSKVTGMQIVTG